MHFNVIFHFHQYHVVFDRYLDYSSFSRLLKLDLFSLYTLVELIVSFAKFFVTALISINTSALAVVRMVTRSRNLYNLLCVLNKLILYDELHVSDYVYSYAC